MVIHTKSTHFVDVRCETNLGQEDIKDAACDGERQRSGEESEEPGGGKHRHTEVLGLEVVEQVWQLLLQTITSQSVNHRCQHYHFRRAGNHAFREPSRFPAF